MSTNWNALREDHEIAYLRRDLATSSPQSYSLEEMKRISEEMDASTKAIDAAMRADFWSMPAEARNRMLDLLGGSGCETREWWEELLGLRSSNALETA
jgi:hypothetical protein